MNVLQEAEGLINGDRREAYGDPLEQESRIAALWSAYLSREIVAADVSNMMILLKLSRAKAQLNRGLFHRDSYVDICGYAGLAEKLHNSAVDLDDESDDWSFFIEHMTQPVTPRVWESLGDVPLSAKEVSDRDGDVWKWSPWNGWQCWLDGHLDEQIQDSHRYAPFTEIIEETA